MNMRCKVLKCKGTTIIRYVASAKNPLDRQVARVLEQGSPAVLLPFSVVETSSAAAEVHYDVTRLVTLSEYAKTPLGADGFCALLNQMRQLIESCIAIKLPLKNIVLDANQVYCDPWANHALRFIYLPFEGIAPDVSAMRAFFANLPAKLKNPEVSARPLIARYSGYFNGAAPFSPTDYLAFLDELVRPTVRSESSTSHSPADSTFCLGLESASDSSESKAFEEERRGKHVRVDPGTGVLNQVSWNMFADQETFEERFADAPIQEDRIAVPDPLSTTVLEDLSFDDDSGTIHLQDLVEEPPSRHETESPVLRKRFFLKHRRSGERFEVRGAEFVVGKSKYCSYQVKDTTTVSRRHAIFCCSEDECWIEDNGSTNGTLVDGVPLGSHERFRLRGGEVIRMSDEDFTFETVRE